MRSRSALVLAVAALLAACGGDGPAAPDATPPGQQPPGTPPGGQPPVSQPPGNTPPAGGGRFDNPAGARFVLPAGLEVVGRLGSLTPASADSIPGCLQLDTAAVKRVGTGNRVVNVCFQLRNTTTRTIEVDLPPRIIVISKRDKDQHGVLLEYDQRIVVLPGRTVWVHMQLFCINESRSAGDAWSDYEFGPTTDDPGLVEISELVRGKNLSGFQSGLAVQLAVWEVTDGEGLTDATRQVLRGLPAK